METIKRILAWIGGIATFILALFAIFKSNTIPKQLNDENEKKILTKESENIILESDVNRLEEKRKDLESNHKKEIENVKDESLEDLAKFFNDRNKS